MPGTSNLFQESFQHFADSEFEQPSLGITVGCEFEFLLMSYDEEPQEHEIAPQYGRKLILGTLQQQLQTKCESCGVVESFKLRLNEDAKCDLDKWQVAYDNSIKLYDDELDALGQDFRNYSFSGIEVKSRILGQTPHHPKKCCGRGLSVAEEIEAVLGKLNSEYRRYSDDGSKVKHFIYTNSSTGLHIHVGKAYGSFPQPSIRRILSLLVACEQLIDCLHSRDRINGFIFDDGKGLRNDPFPKHPVLDSRIYNKPLSMLFIADADRKRRRDRNMHGEDYLRSAYELSKPEISETNEKPDENFTIWLAPRMANIESWILRIRYTDDIEDLLILHREPLQNNKRCVFNMWNLREYEGQDCFDTVEFRQHRGTLRVPVVLNYINVLTRLVVFCHYTNDAEFFPLIEQNGKFRSSDFDLADFCQAIGCRKETQHYYERQLDDDQSDILQNLDEQLAIMAKFSPKYPLAALAIHNLEEERDGIRPRNVKARIHDKLTCGGYGQQSEAYYVAPLNDEATDPWDVSGVIGWGYASSPESGDTDPRLSVDHCELPERIRQTLNDMAAGKFVPMLPDAESEQYGNTSTSPSS